MQLHHKIFGSGEPIIVLHGLYGSSDNWYNIGKKLSDNFTIYLLDQRNHGNSPHLSSHTYENLRIDLKKFIDNKKLTNITLIGHSMGGKVAMFYAMKFPQTIKNLIIIDISPRDYNIISADGVRQTSNHKQFLSSLNKLDLSQITSRADAEKFLFKEIHDKRVCQFLLKNLKRNANHIFEWKINLPTITSNLSNMLKGVPENKTYKGNNPVLFIKAANSKYIIDDDEYLIRNIFPKAEIVVIPNAGHWVHVEQPDLLVKTIKYFIA